MNKYSPYPGNPPGAPSLGMGMPIGGGRNIRPDRVKTMAMIFANPYSATGMGYGESWTIAEVGMGSTVKGANWQVYRNRCYDLGIPYKAFYDVANAGSGQAGFAINAIVGGAGGPYGDAVAAFAGANFDYIAWGYSPPQNWLQRVDYWAAKAGRPTPKQGFYFLNFHNLNQAVPYDALGDELRQAQIDTGQLFESTVSAGSGCVHVDIYRTDGSGAVCTSGGGNCGISHARGTSSTHTWELEYNSIGGMANLATQMATIIRDRIATYWPLRKPDFMITDNALPDGYGGTADNFSGSGLDLMSAADYRTMWNQWPTAFKLANPGIEFWGNHGLSDETYYTASQIPGRYGEYAFTTDTAPGSTSANLATLQGRILSAKTLGTKWAVDHGYNAGTINLWHTSNGPGGGLTWSALRDYSVSVGAQDNFIPLACRTSSGFYTHYQPEFSLE